MINKLSVSLQIVKMVTVHSIPYNYASPSGVYSSCMIKPGSTLWPGATRNLILTPWHPCQRSKKSMKH